MYCCVAINSGSTFNFEQKTNHSWNERQSVADGTVEPVEFLQTRCIVSAKEDEIDIDCHC